MYFCRPAIVALSFRNQFSAQTFSNKKINDVLILPRGYQADDLRKNIFLFRLRIKFSAIRVYAHVCVCPDKAGQMYFGSMIYATRIIISM